VVDMVASYKVSDQFTFYVDVNNLFDAKAPYNPPNYAAANYNPTWSQSGVIGRAFRAGARFRF
jgi:iron complex outermembrane recepter protein